MRWTDDDIENTLGRLDPAHDLTDDKINIARGRAALTAVIAAQTVPTPTATVRRRTILAGATACAVAAIFAIGVPLVGLDAPPANGYGPQPLPFTPLAKSLSQVVTEARADLRNDSTGVDTPIRESTSNGWFAEISGNVTDDALTAVRPQNRHLVWDEDLSGRETVTAGTPYLPDGTPIVDPTPAPGTVLVDTTYDIGEFASPYGTTPAADPDSLAAPLAGPDGGAAETMNGMASLLNTWTIPNSVHAALLDILANHSNVTVEGSTTDRAGRAAIGLRATSTLTPWFDVIALISADTGRIIGVEEIYTGLDDQLAIPPGTTTSYTLWETEP